MQLSKYISDLLYRYECVIVPDFGGFVSNNISSQINIENHQFSPPSKIISFNVNLQQNDGLLINHIAKSLNITFDDAAEKIQHVVEKWQIHLQKEPLFLDKIGQLNLDDEHLIFEPLNKINYLTSSFGLSDVSADYILRPKSKSSNIENKKPYGKYIASAGIALGILFAGNLYVKQKINQQEVLAQKKVTHQIQQASFNILKPLPAVRLTVEKEVIKEKKTLQYHIVAGAFKIAKNATRKVTLLKAKGFDAKIIGVNKWGLTQVSYASFDNKIDAINHMNYIRKNDNKHAWLFINQ